MLPTLPPVEWSGAEGESAAAGDGTTSARQPSQPQQLGQQRYSMVTEAQQWQKKAPDRSVVPRGSAPLRGHSTLECPYLWQMVHSAAIDRQSRETWPLRPHLGQHRQAGAVVIRGISGRRQTHTPKKTSEIARTVTSQDVRCYANCRAAFCTTQYDATRQCPDRGSALMAERSRRAAVPALASTTCMQMMKHVA